MANFRRYVLKSGREVFGGKNSKTNDELVKSSKKEDVIVHTKNPGSPFVRIGEDPSKEEIYEAGIFCAKYSQSWRDRKSDVLVNVFLRKDMKKGIFSKEGSWKVKKFEEIKIKKSDILNFEKKNEAD